MSRASVVRAADEVATRVGIDGVARDQGANRESLGIHFEACKGTGGSRVEAGGTDASHIGGGASTRDREDVAHIEVVGGGGVRDGGVASDIEVAVDGRGSGREEVGSRDEASRGEVSCVGDLSEEIR